MKHLSTPASLRSPDFCQCPEMNLTLLDLPGYSSIIFLCPHKLKIHRLTITPRC